MDNNTLISIINDIVERERLYSHKPNNYRDFKVDYYSVTREGRVLEAGSPLIFQDAIWGFFVVYYAYRKYNGYYAHASRIYHVSYDGSINSEYLNVGSWRIRLDSKVDVTSYFIYANKSSASIGFSCKNETIKDVLEDLLKILPQVNGCETQDAVDQVLLRIQNS